MGHERGSACRRRQYNMVGLGLLVVISSRSMRWTRAWCFVCSCVCACMRASACMCVYARACAFMCVRVCVLCTCARACVRACVRACACVCVCVCVRARKHARAAYTRCIFARACASISVCLCDCACACGRACACACVVHREESVADRRAFTPLRLRLPFRRWAISATGGFEPQPLEVSDWLLGDVPVCVCVRTHTHTGRPTHALAQPHAHD